MEQRSFKSFIDLISFDKTLHKFHKTISNLSDELEVFVAEKELLEKEQNKLRARVHDLKKEVDAKELDMKELDEQEKAKRAKLDAAQSDREYHSLKREAEGLKKRQHDFEETLISVWASYETARKEEARKSKEIQEKIDKIVEKETEYQQDIEHAQQQIDAADGERSQKLKLVPDEWLTQYERMKNSVPDPVVKAQDGSCTACFHLLSPQERITISGDDLIPCKGCYRLLYTEATPEEAALDELEGQNT